MRIFFGITGQLGYGGLVQQSVMLVKYLREFGCQVFALVGLAPPHNDEVALEELDYTFDAFNIADYVLREKSPLMRWLLGWYARHWVATAHPQKLKGNNGPTSPAMGVSVKKLLHNLVYCPDEGDIEKVNRLRREFRPDLDYACELSMAGYFGMLDDLRVPLVSSAQGYELCLRYGVNIVPLIRANAGRIDAVISGSEANVRENVARDLPFLLPKTHVIHYGIVDDENYAMSVDEARRRTRAFVRDSDDFIIMSLGRVEVEKGCDLALHVLRILLNSGVPARLRIVGDTMVGEDYRSVVKTKIAMMDLEDRVDLIGFVEGKADKVALLKTSDALLATFIKSEPFGLVLCEAMAAGIPVVAPDTGAGAEILLWNSHRCGLVYRAQDTGQMADRLRYLAEHPGEAAAMGEAGMLAVREHFNARRMARDILSLFEDVVARRKLSRMSFHTIQAQ